MMARTVGKKYFCLKPLRFGGICYCIMTQPTLTAPPPLLGPIQTIPCGYHTDIFPGLKLGADGHLVIATANDLERAREVMIGETATAPTCECRWPASAVLSFLQTQGH